MSIIEKFDRLIHDYSDVLDVIKHITPTNLNDENKEFLRQYRRGYIYNPQYNYVFNEDLNSAMEEIKCFSFGKDDVISKIYTKYQNYILDNIELMHSVGNNLEFTNISAKLYGTPSENILREANNILENNIPAEDYKYQYDAYYLKNKFEKRLKELNYCWEVIIAETLSSKVAVDSEKRIIYINGKVKFTDNDIHRLIVHEINTHVVRSENGYRQAYMIFQNGFPNSTETEEGLAIYNEDINHVLDIQAFRLYAGRVIAVDACMNKSFYEIFEKLSVHFSEYESLRIVSRVKRGLKDTSENGGFTKDYVYLNGYYRVKNTINIRNKKYFYVGVVGVDDIPQLEELEKSGKIVFE